MEFFQYLSTYQFFRKDGSKVSSPKVMYKELLAEMGVPRSHQETVTYNQLRTEHDWYDEGCPYYNVYPGVSEPLMNFRLDIPIEAFKIPFNAFVLRFPYNSLKFDTNEGPAMLQTVLVSEALDISRKALGNMLKHGIKPKGGTPTITLWIDYGECDSRGFPILIFRRIPKTEGATIEECLDALPTHPDINIGMRVPPEIITDTVRLTAGCCAISRDADDELVRPDILSKDRRKWDSATEEQRQKMIERAARVRHARGWDVGRDLPTEKSPHYRHAHLMRAWTGKGRTELKIVKRRGHWVHRDKIEQMPTGHGDE